MLLVVTTTGVSLVLVVLDSDDEDGSEEELGSELEEDSEAVDGVVTGGAELVTGVELDSVVEDDGGGEYVDARGGFHD